MKLALCFSVAFAGEPVPESPSAIEEAVQMNERLATILDRIEDIQQMEQTTSTPVQRTKEGEPAPSQPTPPPVSEK